MARVDLTTFAAARERIEALRTGERLDPRVNPDCASRLLEHGAPTRRAIVFLHGITSSPFQFAELGAQFHARGYSVLIPRLPRHGYRDRLSPDHAGITRAEFISSASRAIDLARGLGEHLTVAGLSVSGVLAAWCAQTRADVDLAVLIAPSFAPYGVPAAAVPVLARIALRLPNQFVWWDPARKAAIGPTCGYPRFATHALAESFLLAAAVGAQAGHHAPRAGSILAITNAGDPAVNNAVTRSIVGRWRKHPGSHVRAYEFGREPALPHDLIGPYQPKARVDAVYPILRDLIDAAGA